MVDFRTKHCFSHLILVAFALCLLLVFAMKLIGFDENSALDLMRNLKNKIVVHLVIGCLEVAEKTLKWNGSFARLEYSVFVWDIGLN